MSTNPSHILIARNSRGHNPSASLSSPTETHAAASGVFRSTGSPSLHVEGSETDEPISDLSTEEDEEAIEIEETFTRRSRFPGTVKIVVESTTFWAHKEILYYASPFFEAALSGNWLETGRPQSMSSVITISQPPTIPGNQNSREAATEMTLAPIDSEIEAESELIKSSKDGAKDRHKDEDREVCSDASSISSEARSDARSHALAKLEMAEGDIKPSPTDRQSELTTKKSDVSSTMRFGTGFRRRARPDAVIVLKEERASTFHDFLKFVYPHLVCTITWNNVEGLMNISHKLCLPSLQRECSNFLLTHAAGKPIKAMRIAELFEEEELYRESSRFVLDNPGGWTEQELNTLSQETLLKLEKRRSWFLERVLKLGLTMIAKEYQCCGTCPETATCARLLEEKWKQAYHAVFRFGAPQPSMVYRYLRMLEGVSPPLLLAQTACQTSARAFVATLFDRMFSLGVRGSGADAAPLGARVAVAANATGLRRHFLYCTLKPEPTPQRPRRSREIG